MLRRLHVVQLSPGEIPLDSEQARHAVEVLRLETGSPVEVFDDAGFTAIARLNVTGGGLAAVLISDIAPPARTTGRVCVASAVPKGERADRMIEKLSEVGADAFVPLATARSVVHPEGRNKHARWERIATEAAKQSRRPGVMRIEPLTHLADAIEQFAPPPTVRIALSTETDAQPLALLLASVPSAADLALFVGPEGGWTPDELSLFAGQQFRFARLTPTILRVETAAVLAAGLCNSLRQAGSVGGVA